MSLYISATLLAFALALSMTPSSSSSIVPYPPIPERYVSNMCASITCRKGTVCRVVTACVSMGCFPHATCVPCVPEGADAICNANRYIYAVLMVKPPQQQSSMNRLTPLICDPTRTNAESGCHKGSVCVASEQSKQIGNCCYGKPERLIETLTGSLSTTTASNNDPICDEPSDLCGDKCPEGTYCVPTRSDCGQQLTYSCKAKPKPGTCPPVPFSTPELCLKVRMARLCEADSDCKGDKKCCKTLCGGSACLSPY